jgi:hypothetical protein
MHIRHPCKQIHRFLRHADAATLMIEGSVGYELGVWLLHGRRRIVAAVIIRLDLEHPGMH